MDKCEPVCESVFNCAEDISKDIYVNNVSTLPVVKHLDTDVPVSAAGK
jgi:hypothetical protein